MGCPRRAKAAEQDKQAEQQVKDSNKAQVGAKRVSGRERGEGQFNFPQAVFLAIWAQERVLRTRAFTQLKQELGNLASLPDWLAVDADQGIAYP